VHLNLTFSALITLNNSGILTAIITSFAHGLSSVGLFIFVGTVISRTYTRNIDSLFFLDFQSRCILLFLLLCNLSFPATLNFYGEILSVVSLISIPLKLLKYLYSLHTEPQAVHTKKENLVILLKKVSRKLPLYL
jgi:NADH:ubiquinone oxidoreductase subunit 4 (subunit M)